MNKITLKLLAITFIALTFSCSRDSDDNTQQSVSLYKTVEFTPQGTGFTNKYVTYFTDNKKVNDTTYNASGAVVQTHAYTYTAETSTTLTYNVSNILQSKAIFTYDSSNRIATIDFYDGANQLQNSRQYIYNGHDINVSFINGGVSTLKYLYKTNSNGLLYYEKNLSNNVVQTLDYTNDFPTQLNNDTETILFECYPTIKPVAIQNNTNEINNYALINLILQHMNLSCNYYLKKTTITAVNGQINYEKEFDTDNYQTHQLITVAPESGAPAIASEKFFYYN